jgi:hypothetical protein
MNRLTWVMETRRLRSAVVYDLQTARSLRQPPNNERVTGRESRTGSIFAMAIFVRIFTVGEAVV